VAIKPVSFLNTLKTKIKWWLWLGCIIMLLLYKLKLFWIVVIVFITGLLLYGYKNTQFYHRCLLTRYGIGFLFFFILGIALKMLVFEWYHVPTNSMGQTICAGDRILANKLAYGPRLPQSPFDIPWVNLLFLIRPNNRQRIGEKWWQPHRLSGYTKIKQNDIIIFHIPANMDMVIVKRCVALPGDTIELLFDQLYVNNIKETHTNNLLFTKKVYGSNLEQLEHQWGQFRVFSVSTKAYITLSAVSNSWATIESDPDVDSCSTILADTSLVFPYSKNLGWEASNYGPLVIPQIGTQIPLTYENYYKYKHTIQCFEGDSVRIDNGFVLINNVPQKSYTFKNNYYWAMGDNRNLSIDSRYWGFVPESYIIGKAERVLFSINSNGFRWQRIFKKLD
jgi:signal peptidase I